VGTAFALISLVTTLIALKREELEKVVAESAPAPVT
jgi:hypothetical protein